MDNMSRVSLHLAYDGPALDEGLMDVRDLAPALLAFGDLVQEASAVVYGDDHKVRVNVRAHFQRGSFGIDIDLVTTFWQGFVGLVSSKEGQAIVALLGLIGFNGRDVIKMGRERMLSLVELVRRLRGRQPTQTIKNADGSITFIVDDAAWTVPSDVAKLAADARVRNSLDAVLAPLDRDGIDLFETRDENGETIDRVTKEERDYFRAPATIATEEHAEPLIDQVSERVFGIMSLSFKDGNKWRLSDGDSSMYATIEDAEFLREIESRNVAFSKGDSLRCQARLRQFQTATGPRNDWSVLKVIEHIKAPRQVTMRLPNHDSE